MSVRAFVAVKLGDACKSNAARVLECLRPEIEGGKWVSADNLHLTLSFLGEIDPNILAKVAAGLESADVPGPFDLGFRGLGAFPNERKAAVLWAGVSVGADSASLLARGVRVSCAKCGIAPDNREWSAHLTLARFRRPVALAGLEVFAKLRQTEIGICEVDRYFLMQSHLRPGGPEYEVLREYHLKGGKS